MERFSTGLALGVVVGVIGLILGFAPQLISRAMVYAAPAANPPITVVRTALSIGEARR